MRSKDGVYKPGYFWKTMKWYGEHEEAPDKQGVYCGTMNERAGHRWSVMQRGWLPSLVTVVSTYSRRVSGIQN